MIRVQMIAAILLMIGSAHAGNITACASGCDYDSIQEAVYGARPHDTIVLFSGSYNESTFLTKPLNFSGVDTGSGEPDVQGDLYTNGYEFTLEGFGFSSINEAPAFEENSSDKMGAAAWFGKGYSLSSDSEYEEAIKAYDEALKLNPDLAAARFLKARALYEVGRYDESIIAVQAALRIDHNCSSAWNHLGASLAMQNKNNEAVDAYDKSLDLDAEFASAWGNKGYALMSLGKYEESVQSFEQGLKLNAKNAFAWNGMGQSLDALNRYDEALQAFDKAIELNPEYSEPWSNKGKVLYELNKYEDAIEACEEAIRMDKNYSTAWNNKGAALAALGKYGDAVAAYDEALRLNPTNEATLMNREDALKKQESAKKADIPSVIPTAFAPAVETPVKLPIAATAISKEDNTASATDLLYSDDFSGSFNWKDKWATHVNKDGRLYITINKRQYASMRDPTIKAFKDCIIEAEATLEDGSLDNAFGLLFRNAGSKFYRFKISGKGEFGFDLYLNGKWVDLVPWTKSEAINTGKASNLIRAQCRGNRFTFYVNGVNLGEYIDDTFPDSGKAGLFADSTTSNGVKVSFDNLKIWAVTA